FEILDNGPLRFTVRFTYPEAFTADSEPYTETRLVRLDAGDFLNRSELTYAGLDSAAAVAGIVVHRQNPDAYVLDPEKGIMAYSDLTDNPDAGNGVIYLGLIAPQATSLGYEPLQESRGDAVGHILASFPAAGESPVVYYWGSGWSKGGMPDADSWTDYLRQFRNRIDEPLQVTIE
ncbi:MAG: DUF4861 domain-containing protein, partial [Muribaculaceae bacterium]|nr:DUF4861 domain-containing protein [Muribaculaceae bacterium]